ncbi:Hypothetical protein NocV09_00901180 [Nannochloropsis oceanica]
MAPRSVVLTTRVILAVLFMNAFIVGTLHYRHTVQHEDGTPVLYNTLSADELPPGVANLRGTRTSTLQDDSKQLRQNDFTADRGPRTRRYLVVIPLIGLKVDDRASHESERLTLKAWDALANHISSLRDEEHEIELRVVGMVENTAHCDSRLFGPSADLLSSGAASCVTLDLSCGHPDFDGVLTMDCILNMSLEIGEVWEADVYILANGDVVFTPTLTEAIDFALDTFGDGKSLATSPPHFPITASLSMREVEKSVTEAKKKIEPPPVSSTSSATSSFSTLSTSLPTQPSHGFVMVGRRMDLSVALPKNTDDPPLTEDDLLHSDIKVRLHPATGIDYFAFTPNIIPRTFPPYLVGRWRWDNALLIHFLSSNAASIDASEVVHALHIGMGSFDSASHAARPGGQYNDDIATNMTGSRLTLGRIDFTKYILKQREMTEEEKEEAKRQQHRLSLEVERRSQPLGEAQLAALRVTDKSSFADDNSGDQQRQQQTKVKGGKTVFLLPVQAGEKALALEWVRWARGMKIDNYLLLAADRSEALALECILATNTTNTSSSSSTESRGGEVVWMDPGKLRLRGWDGSKAYFEQKTSGRASPAVLALATGQLIERLLRLDLAVVLLPSLLPSTSLMSSSVQALLRKENDVFQKDGRVMTALVASLLSIRDEEACDVTLWEEGQVKIDKINAAQTTAHGIQETVFSDENEQRPLPFAYALFQPTSTVLKGWEVVLSCLEEDVRHTKSQQGLCLTKAVRLAAFSFATYGDPTGSRWLRLPDGTDLGFQSDDLVRNNFKSLLLVHILQARNLPEERGGLIERALSGFSCDPYVITAVNNSWGADIAITKAKSANSNPDFFQRFFLYVEDPNTTDLELTVKDKNLLKGDDVIGHCLVPLTQLLDGSKGEGAPGQEGVMEWAGTLQIESVHKDFKDAGTIDVELQLVPLNGEAVNKVEYDSNDQDVAESDADGSGSKHGKFSARGPKSVLEGIDWNELGARVGGVARGLGRYQFACFLTNEETDTQGGIWFDAKAKEIIVSFRGTQMEWKDLLTDMAIYQEGLDGPEDPRLVHAGFRRAFRSIQGGVLQALNFIASNLVEDGWSIDVCGHSLGGALACLMAHEIDRRMPALVEEGRLNVFSFGAPRVGNTAFCEDYDKRLKNQSFRIVNGLDVVARMPRGSGESSLLMEYSHCGRTVLLTETEDGRFSVWVEGESEGTCPLKEGEAFTSTTPTSQSMAEIIKKAAIEAMERGKGGLEFETPFSKATFANGTAASVQEMLRAAGNFTNLQAMLSSTSSIDYFSSFTSIPSSPSLGPFGQLSLQTDLQQIANAVFGSAMNSTATIGKSLGLNETFVDSELSLIRGLVYGDALAHHMEPLYYVALEKAFGIAMEEGVDDKKGEEKGDGATKRYG